MQPRVIVRRTNILHLMIDGEAMKGKSSLRERHLLLAGPMRAHETTIPPDPRLGSVFFPQFMPLCDLEEPPSVNATQPNDRVRLEFLSVYYHLNLALAKRLSAPEDLTAAARSALQDEIARWLTTRDQLEDRHAPYGVIAEPTVEKGFAVNLAFTFPTESRWFHEQRSKRAWEARLEFKVPDQADNRGPDCQS